MAEIEALVLERNLLLDEIEELKGNIVGLTAQLDHLRTEEEKYAHLLEALIMPSANQDDEEEAANQNNQIQIEIEQLRATLEAIQDKRCSLLQDIVSLVKETMVMEEQEEKEKRTLLMRGIMAVVRKCIRDEPELRTRELVGMMDTILYSKTRMCNMFQKGMCALAGADCRFAHGEQDLKARLCYQFLDNGYCHGDECRYRHCFD